MMQDRDLADATEDRGSEEVQFKLIYAATFVAMLLAGCVAQFLPRRIRSRSQEDASIIRRAKEKAWHFSAFAFMG